MKNLKSYIRHTVTTTIVMFILAGDLFIASKTLVHADPPAIVSQAWNFVIPQELKYRTREVTFAGGNSPKILLNTQEGLYGIDEQSNLNPDIPSPTIKLLLPSPDEFVSWDAVLLPSPVVASPYIDAPFGLIVHGDHVIRRLQIVNGAGKVQMKLEDSRHLSYRLSPDGKSIVGVDSRGKHIGQSGQRFTYRFFSDRGQVIGEVTARPGTWDQAFHTPDSKGFLINDRIEGLSFYETSTTARRWSIPGKTKFFSSSDSVVDRTIVVMFDSNRHASLYEKGKLSWTLDLEKQEVHENIRNIAISANGEFIAVSGNRTLLLLSATNSNPVGRFQVAENLTINSVSVSAKGMVILGTQQAHLSGNDSAFGKVFVLNRTGTSLHQENTHHERSNAWTPTVQFDQSGQLVLIQTRESLHLRRVNEP